MYKEFQKIPELFRLSFPILFSSLSISVINLLGIPILGNYSVDAMAASAIAVSLHLIFFNVFLALYLGFRVLASKALGAEDNQKAQVLFSSTLTSTLAQHC